VGWVVGGGLRGVREWAVAVAVAVGGWWIRCFLVRTDATAFTAATVGLGGVVDVARSLDIVHRAAQIAHGLAQGKVCVHEWEAAWASQGVYDRGMVVAWLAAPTPYSGGQRVRRECSCVRQPAILPGQQRLPCVAHGCARGGA
jgi:hypothetical protein